MKQVIKQAACNHWSQSDYKEKAEESYSKDDICAVSAMARKVSYASFEAGAKWQSEQSPWISVEEYLPKNDNNVFYTNYLSGALGVGYYVNGNWYEAYTGTVVYGITHWMPIPKINE